MTSVHAKYLLKEIAPGDPLLEGLAPHGTRVRLRLRDKGFLKDRTIKEIVQYWVVLPACKVLYSDKDSPPESIGFASPTEALNAYYPISTGSESPWERGFEVRTASKCPRAGNGHPGVTRVPWIRDFLFRPRRTYRNYSHADCQIPEICQLRPTDSDSPS